MNSFENDRPIRPDNRDALTPEEFGSLYARKLKRELQQGGRELPENMRYLALGVGQAQPELAFAEALEIPMENITLVDKQFSPDAVQRLTEKSFTGTKLEQDMFEALEKPIEDKYGIVTLFGAEYAIEERDAIERLTSGLATKMSPNGIVMIIPYAPIENASDIWRAHHFGQINTPKEKDRWIGMIYQPNK